MPSTRIAVNSTSSSPVCLAWTLLDFNRLAARLAEIDTLAAKCERDATARLQSDKDSNIPRDVAQSNASRVFRICLERNQRRRGEIWIFTPISGTPQHISSRPINLLLDE